MFIGLLGFWVDFTDFLSSIIKLNRVIIVGDFNIHVDNAACNTVLHFLNLMDTFNFVQHVSGPTHDKGHLLDLVFSHGLNIDDVCTEDVYVSDHKCVLFNLACNENPLPVKRVSCSRMITQVAVEHFLTAFDPNSVIILNDIDSSVQSFNDHCTLLLDKVAPFRKRYIPVVNTSPWINDAIRSLRRVCRKTKRLWKSTQLQVHRLFFKELLSNLNEMIKVARVLYFKNLVLTCKRNPKNLFDTINRLVSPITSSVPVFSNDDCNNFLSHFVGKVMAVRASILPSAIPSVTITERPSILSSFQSISFNDLIKIVCTMKPSQSPADILPASVVMETITSIGPCLVSIVNLSLKLGQVPRCFKHAVVEKV